MSRKTLVLSGTAALIIVFFFIISILNIYDSYNNTIEYVKSRNMDDAKLEANQFEIYFKDRQNDIYSYSIMESNYDLSGSISNNHSEFDLLIYYSDDNFKVIQNNYPLINASDVIEVWKQNKEFVSNSHSILSRKVYCSKATNLGSNIYGLIFCISVPHKSSQDYLIGVVSLNRFSEKYIYSNTRSDRAKPFAISSEGRKIMSYDKTQIGKMYNDPQTYPTKSVLDNYLLMSKGEIFSTYHISNFQNSILSPNQKPSKKILSSYPVKLDGDFKFSIGTSTQVSDIGFFTYKLKLQILLTIILFPAFLTLVIIIVRLLNLENQMKIEAKESAKYTNELKNLNEKITEQNASLENANKQLQEYDRIKTDYFANMSHELRMPLTVIISSTQLMEKHTEIEQYSEKSVKWIKIIKQNAQRLSRLVNNLLTITKLESKSITLNKQNTDIVRFLSNILQLSAPFIEKKQLNIHFETVSKRIICSIDRDKFEKVILNLLSNAIKFNKPNGSIFIRINRDKSLIIEIEDTGIGIPKDKLNLIFERFVQLNHVYTREYEGSGIGLSLCKDFINMHNGQITVDSSMDCGTKFIINLPIESDLQHEEDKTCNFENDINIELSDIV